MKRCSEFFIFHAFVGRQQSLIRSISEVIKAHLKGWLRAQSDDPSRRVWREAINERVQYLLKKFGRAHN